MNAALLLGLFALVSSTVAPRLLADASWVVRNPRGGIVVWQALTFSLAASVLLGGLALALPVLPVGDDLTDLLGTTHVDVTDPYTTPAGDQLATVGLVAVVGVAVRLVTTLLLELRRASRERRLQTEALRLVGSPHPSKFTMLDHPLPLAYGLPGRDRTVVVTRGALDALSAQELSAVVAHEQGHLRARHALALTVSAALVRCFRGVPVFRTAHHQIERLTEMQADDSALTLADRLAMASALAVLSPRAAAGRLDPRLDDPLTARVGRLLRVPARTRPRQRALVGLGTLTLLATPFVTAMAPAVDSARGCQHVAAPVQDQRER